MTKLPGSEKKVIINIKTSEHSPKLLFWEKQIIKTSAQYKLLGGEN